MNDWGAATKVWVGVLLVALVLAVVDRLLITISVLLLILAGVLFGIFINGLSGWLQRHSPLSYRWSYSLVTLLIVTLTAGGLYYMGSQFLSQTSQLVGQLRESSQQLTDRLQQFGWAEQYLSTNGMPQNMNTLLPAVKTTAEYVMWGLTGAVVIVFVGLYVAYDPHLYREGMIKLVSRDRRRRAAEVLDRLRNVLSNWITGRLISMAIVGILTAIGLYFLGVPLPVTLGVLAAILTFIPNLGPVLATVPQALLALQVGTSTVLYVILFNIVLQTVESYLITPMIQRYEVTLPPVITITAQLIMGVVVGVIGIMMAAPLAVILMLLVQTLYISEKLGDSDPGELAEMG